jgi:hypothetical protein
MAGFLGGSAYNMVRDIAEGMIIPTELTFKRFRAEDFNSFLFELERLVREVRATQPPTNDVEAVQKRHRRMQRLQQAMSIASNLRSRLR